MTISSQSPSVKLRSPHRRWFSAQHGAPELSRMRSTRRACPW